MLHIFTHNLEQQGQRLHKGIIFYWDRQPVHVHENPQFLSTD